MCGKLVEQFEELVVAGQQTSEHIAPAWKALPARDSNVGRRIRGRTTSPEDTPPHPGGKGLTAAGVYRFAADDHRCRSRTALRSATRRGFSNTFTSSIPAMNPPMCAQT